MIQETEQATPSKHNSYLDVAKPTTPMSGLLASWNWIAVVRGVLFISYPAIIYVGLQYLEPRHLAWIILIALLLRSRNSMRAMLSRFNWVDGSTFLGLLLVGVIFVGNDERWLLLYPVLVNLGMLFSFGYSLYRPPNMIERFAHINHRELTPAEVYYFFRLTLVWCLFFVMNGSIALYTALFSTRESWVLYNGFIAYVLIASLIVGEWCYRKLYLKWK